MNSPIYKDFYYTADTASLEYYIVADDMIIFRGKVWRNPDTGVATVHVGDIIRDYLRFDLPDFRPLDDVVTRQENAYKVFGLYNASGTKLDEYKVLFDWYGEWNGETKVLSNPIDGILDPRMKILWTIYGPTAMDVIMENGPLTIDSFFRLLTTNIVLGQDGGEYDIRWLTDYMPSNEWTVTIDGLSGFTYHDANFSGITIDFPRNDTVSAFTYDIYYHIHGLTFGPTHMVQNGGRIDIDPDSPGGGGPDSGSTGRIDWDSTFPDSAFTYSADTWIQVTNLGANGCDITFRESNESLEPRTGHVWIFINGNLAKTITVTQAGRYFRNMTPLITFPPSGGESGITWETDIPLAALTASTDSGDFVLSDLQQYGMNVATTGINMNYGYISGNASVYSGTTFLGSTEIRQEGMYFHLDENPVHINSWTGSYLLHWDTNIPPEYISWRFDGEDINGSISDTTQTDFTLNVHNSAWYDKIAYVDFYFSGETFLETLTVYLKGNVGYDLQDVGEVQITGTETYKIPFDSVGDQSRVYDEERGLWVAATEYFNWGTLYYASGFFNTGSTPSVTIQGTTYAKVLNLQIDKNYHTYDRLLKYAIVLADSGTPIPVTETFTVDFGVEDAAPVHYVVTSQLIGTGYTNNTIVPTEVYDYANASTIIVHGDSTEPNAVNNHSVVSGIANDIEARVRIPEIGSSHVITYKWRAVKHNYWSGGYDYVSGFFIAIDWSISNFPPSKFTRPEVFTYGTSSGNSYIFNLSVVPASMTIEEATNEAPASRVTAVTIDNSIKGLTMVGMTLDSAKFKAIYYNGTKDEFIAIRRRFAYTTYSEHLNMLHVYCTDGTLGWTPGSDDAQYGHPEGYIEILN